MPGICKFGGVLLSGFLLMSPNVFLAIFVVFDFFIFFSIFAHLVCLVLSFFARVLVFVSFLVFPVLLAYYPFGFCRCCCF